MAKMKTLTVSGQTYTVNDPEAVSFCTKQALTSLQQQIARENIGACTVEQTVDRLCPPFSEADTMVACRPVEGSALAAVSGIVPRQDGTGDPSPDNIRPISGYTAVKLTHSNDTDTQEFTLDLGQTVYGGYMDWATGLLTIDREMVTLKGDNAVNFTVEKLSAPACTRIAIKRAEDDGEIHQGVCNHLSSHFKTYHGNHSANVPIWSISGNKTVSRCWLYCDPAVVGTDKSSVNAWLKAQYDAGTPVQVSYKLAMPITVQLTPQEIHALSGENILYSDTGDTTVTGKADPSAIIEKLTNAIIALGGNV